MNSCVKYLTEQYFQHIKSDAQRDILTILESLSGISSIENIRKLLYFYSEVDKSTTNQLKMQPKKYVPYYLKLMLEDLSVSDHKYLYFLLEYLSQCSNNSHQQKTIEKISGKLYFDHKIKDEISEYVQKCIENKLSENDINKLFFVIKNSSLKKINKIHSIYKKGKQTIYSHFAVSQADGDYGIKYLSGNKNSTYIHIFVNGFTNDQSGNNYKIWMEQAAEDIDSNNLFYGFDWPSGKPPAKIIPKSLINSFDVNPKIWLAKFSRTVVAEWKHARDYSEEYAEELADFIQKEYQQNSKIKVHLYGHSLGARLVYKVAERLHNINIEEVFFFGGAVYIDDVSGSNLLLNVKNIYNFYSYNDKILQMMYKASEWETPIGLREIDFKRTPASIGELYNFNVSEFISGHTEYIPNFAVLYRRKYRKEEYR